MKKTTVLQKNRRNSKKLNASRKKYHVSLNPLIVNVSANDHTRHLIQLLSLGVRAYIIVPQKHFHTPYPFSLSKAVQILLLLSEMHTALFQHGH